MTSDRYRELRLDSTMRGWIIGFGVVACGFFWRTSGGGILQMLLTGLGLQALLFLVKRAVGAYERRIGAEGELAPLAVYVFELLVDAGTVLLFALATFRGIMGPLNAI